MPSQAAAIDSNRPEWQRLYEVAAGQAGYFTLAQAQEAGYSPQLLQHHLGRRRIIRVSRGIYRLTFFPPSEDEQLIVIWLWSQCHGVFSHETALSLQELSDALPHRVHLTLPASWESRRLRFPEPVIPHFADVSAKERTWAGNVPVTSPLRTLFDCVQDHRSREFIEQAVREGLARGLFQKEDLKGLSL